ncbi:hypothetical protein O9993_22780 [Vibrio lentus]|nr:hypothetical protein [Vibrio lentus]
MKSAEFKSETMRMEMTQILVEDLQPSDSRSSVIPLWRVTGQPARYLLWVSVRYYMLKGRDLPFARRSFAVASALLVWLRLCRQ